MTLVIAQRSKDRISLASDSRISFGSDGNFDSGIKIFTVPVKLRGPISKIEDRDKWEYEYTYGLAVIGSSINAYTVKDSIAEVLANLQYPLKSANISIHGIGTLVLKVYEDVSRRLGAILRQNGLCEIILAGLCFMAKRIRFLRFFWHIEGGETTYHFAEILKSENLAFYGSGHVVASVLHHFHPSLSPLELIKKTVDNNLDEKVGGPPQYGFFVDDNFRVTGVVDIVIDTENNVITKDHYVRGLSYRMEDNIFTPPMLTLSYRYTPITPLKNLVPKVADDPSNE